VTPALRDRIQRADVNSDGILSVSELLGVLESEKKAQSDRKMFLRLLVALGVAVLVLIATLCGAVYGIVDLTQKVDDNDGAMVSKATGDVMSTGAGTFVGPTRWSCPRDQSDETSPCGNRTHHCSKRLFGGCPGRDVQGNLQKFPSPAGPCEVSSLLI
jgi:hypothetical protein